ncbi:MAG: RNA polymerase sigma factor SigM [Kineosporiaceae bacterium]
MSGEPSDHDLVAAHVAGDAEAFAELFRRHRDVLWAVALRTTSNPDDAADALQDAMLSALRGAATFRGRSAVRTWLYRIVVNACLDRLRRSAARPAVPLTDHDPADPSDAMATTRHRVDLLRALGTLSPGQRAAVVLVDAHGLPVAEVAEILEVPVGTVKSRCARARAHLAKELGGPGRDAATRRHGNPGAAPDVTSEYPWQGRR